MGLTLQAQVIKRVQPVWWFGESAAANFNYFGGLTQVLNPGLTVPTAFNKGQGVKPYFSLLTEYRPNRTLGGMLNIAYDNRGGSFDHVLAPCNCDASLTENIAYIAIEPSIRLAPVSSSFYVCAGPTISFNVAKNFLYKQDKQSDVSGDLSNIKNTILSAQAGAGIDIPVSKKTSMTQMTVSPFMSFQTNYGHDARSNENASVYTIRTGVALKFGSGKKGAVTKQVALLPTATLPAEKDLQFSVRGPKVVPANRQVKETFPLRNSVFFDMGSTKIPERYIMLDKQGAMSFKEQQLQESQPGNLNNGRSARQMAVYHNILNILGDRLRSNPQSSITLTGSSDKDPAQGKVMAENVKSYLVNNFGISPTRISTQGRDKPVIPSELPGVSRELALLKEGDRRVDIESNSSEMLMQVGGVSSPFLKPVQITSVQQDPLDSHVIFTVDSAASQLKSWKVDMTDEQGNVQHYGPYNADQASVPGNTILGTNDQGNYKIMMTGETLSGKMVSKESSVSLMKRSDLKQEGLRYSILFDFDKSKTINSYERFLTDVVAPLISDNGTVIIHGHTDIIGEEYHNMVLSQQRAQSTVAILKNATAGKTNVKYEVYGFGEDQNAAPFENKTPEERFYNRTVIIDIISNK
ncbi:MAG: hypothetical protein NVS3B19_16980 [Ginsengibacter sp.]